MTRVKYFQFQGPREEVTVFYQMAAGCKPTCAPDAMLPIGDRPPRQHCLDAGTAGERGIRGCTPPSSAQPCGLAVKQLFHLQPEPQKPPFANVPDHIPSLTREAHDGTYFSVLVTRTTDHPAPGSDQISRAFQDAWVGVDGYVRPDGTRQKRALAFHGQVITHDDRSIAEAFIVDLSEDVTVPGDEPLEGTATHRPRPPAGTVQRRLTYTADRKYPGLQGPRHWLRSAPDGSRIAMLLKDDDGNVQIWTLSPCGGPLVQVTHAPWSVASAFSWSPDGRQITYVADNSVFVVHAETGRSTRLTPRSSDRDAPRPEACVFSPDGKKIAFIRTVTNGSQPPWNQVFVLFLP